MKEIKHVIADPMGLHARPAGLLVKEAAKNACNVTVAVNGTSVDAKRIMGVMKAGCQAGHGTDPDLRRR